MIINPREAIANGWITGDITEENIQPNGIDFTLDDLYKLEREANVFTLGTTTKKHAKWEKMVPYEALHKEKDVTVREPSYHLQPQSMYDFSSNMRAVLPADGVAALLIVRSTLNRNGLFITSGFYDSGFEGQISGMLRTSQLGAVIARGARIGQIIFMSSDAAKAYDGQYQGIAGHWTEGK